MASFSGKRRGGRGVTLIAGVFLAGVSCYADFTADPAGAFNREIRPILAEHCFQCHGQDAKARKAKLRLDRFDGATAVLPSGRRAIVPGAADASELIHRVTAADPGDRMPPAETGKTLSAAGIDTLRRWIDAGARYEPHWAYVKPERPALPAVKDTSWPRNAIDYFVLARLEQKGISPAPEADPYTLIRRVSFDLTGLPPTIEEADAFVNDTRPDRFEWLVDRLLASPAYGEHIGRHWLDVARYADSNGYHIDTKRSMWPYRDWVIRAFNRNMPFDQFTIEQIAGDLLPDATLEQRIATGFHRNTMFNEEGGIDSEEFRAKAVVDRVSTTMTVWMGTTMACAECHEHKYDPFSQEEFYQLYAFFNNVPERGGGTRTSMAPQVSLPLDSTKHAEIEAIRSVIADLEARQSEQDTQFRAQAPAWALDARETVGAWAPLVPETAVSENGATLDILEDASVFVSGELPDPFVDVYTIVAPAPVGGITALALEVMPDERLPAGGPGREDSGAFVLTHVEVAPVDGEAFALRDARAVYAEAGREPEKTIDADQGYKSGWSMGANPGKADSLILYVEGAAGLETGAKLRVTLAQRLSKYTLGRFRLWVTDAPLEPELPAPHLMEALRTDAAERSEAQNEALFAYYRSRQPGRIDLRVRELEAKIVAIEKSAPTSLVMAEMETPRETRVHIRGDFLNVGEAVSPGVPEVWHALKTAGGRTPNRLDLARWLVDEENPLTARVTVNRFWAMLFGRGLVETAEDFGARGAAPSHPELLDYLATEFVASGWDVKALLRLIVTSATYRQASAVGPDRYQRDPHNTLLARGPRFRLDAECVRDNALAVSGLLVRRMGGPSVYPYQPPGLYEEKIQTGYDVGPWPITYGEDLYRRGVYTFRRRSVPYPTFQTFDAPSFEYCAVSRPRTNTPLQALTTLNDPQFVEAARVLAQRIMNDNEPDLDKRLAKAARLCLTRPAQEREVAHLRAVYEAQRKVFEADPAAAERLVHNGRAPVPEEWPRAEFAAWMVIANILLNLDETVTKG